jgi:glycosyltransferase involved in cell wall biosynthesis
MKKLLYICPACFLDHEFGILRGLNKYFDLHWIVIFNNNLNYHYTPNDILDFCTENNISVEIFTQSARARNPNRIISCFRLLQKVKGLKPDLIYVEVFTDPYFLILTRLFLNYKRVVVGVHDVVFHKKFGSIFNKLTDKLCYRLFNNFHVFSNNQKDVLIRKYPNKNVFVARLFLNVFLKDIGLQPDNKDGSPISNKVKFLFFGIVRYNKGLNFLIEAGNKLAKEYNNFKITVAGKCENPDYYTSLVEEQDAFEIKLYQIPEKQVPLLFSQADFLVLPYRDVTQSGPLLIAFRYNVPIIASDFPGFREYITDGREGFLFEPESIDALYECMKKIMQMSREDIGQMKANVAEYVKKEINIDSIVSKYVAFLNKTADNS